MPRQRNHLLVSSVPGAHWQRGEGKGLGRPELLGGWYGQGSPTDKQKLFNPINDPGEKGK